MSGFFEVQDIMGDEEIMKSLNEFVYRIQRKEVTDNCNITLCVSCQDSEEITNIELADAFQQMYAKQRYNEIFFMIDTCQVLTIFAFKISVHLLALYYI